MDNSLKRLLNDIIDYASEGNNIIVKSPQLTLIVRLVGSYATWIVIYKKMKLRLIGETGERNTIFYSITSFINDVDKESNNADNS